MLIFKKAGNVTRLEWPGHQDSDLCKVLDLAFMEVFGRENIFKPNGGYRNVVAFKNMDFEYCVEHFYDCTTENPIIIFTSRDDIEDNISFEVLEHEICGSVAIATLSIYRGSDLDNYGKRGFPSKLLL